MNCIKKQISIIIILAVSFLVESPLRRATLSIFSFSQSLGYIVTSIAFYVALFACFLICLKTNITLNSVLKSICLSFGFFIIEQIISVFVYNEIIALVFEIIRPLFIFVVILLGYYWLSKIKLNFNKLSLTILCCVFVLGAFFNILEYIHLISVTQNIGNDFFAYLDILTLSYSFYSMVAKLCTYIFTLVLFMRKNNF